MLSLRKPCIVHDKWMNYQNNQILSATFCIYSSINVAEKKKIWDAAVRCIFSQVLSTSYCWYLYSLSVWSLLNWCAAETRQQLLQHICATCQENSKPDRTSCCSFHFPALGHQFINTDSLWCSRRLPAMFLFCFFVFCLNCSNLVPVSIDVLFGGTRGRSFSSLCMTSSLFVCTCPCILPSAVCHAA